MKSKNLSSLCLAALVSSAVLCGSTAALAADDEIVTLIGSSFESGEDGWSGRGAASVAVSRSAAHEGSASLKVTSRTASWNGATIPLDYSFSAGSTYGFEAYVRYDTGTDTDSFKLSLQYNDGTTTQYMDIAKGDVKKGEWTKLSNDKFTIPAGASDMSFYVETEKSTIDFFVDDVKVTGVKGAAPSIPSTPSVTTTGKPQRGDLNKDGVVDSLDLIPMRRLALQSEFDKDSLKLGDLNNNDKIDSEDIKTLTSFVRGEDVEFPPTTIQDGPGDYPKSYDFPAVSQLKSSNDVPDPFIFMDGSKVQSEEDWWRRQAEISCMYEYYMYGKWIDGSDDETSYKISGNKMTITVKRKSTGKTASFNMVINKPATVRHEGGAPVILGMHSMQSTPSATKRGYAVITYDCDGMFTAPGTAQDNNSHKGAFYDLYPYGNTFETQTGELMAWSWGLSRTLDALYAGAAKELNINPENAICTGVSRYGKATAVCGAFDKRFKMCAPSCSGAGGIALYRYMSQGKSYDFSSKGASSSYRYGDNEPLGSLQASGEQAWFNGKFMEFRNANQFPMDQHMLGSLCCDPDRYLFIIGSCVGEDWVNAPSMWMSYCGMKHIWDYVGLSDHLAINIHKEGHAVIDEDMEKMTQYFDYHVYGIQPTMDLKQLQTSVFELPKNKDPYQDTFTSKWLY